MNEVEYTAILAALLAGIAIQDRATAPGAGEAVVVDHYVQLAIDMIAAVQATL